MKIPVTKEGLGELLEQGKQKFRDAVDPNKTALGRDTENFQNPAPPGQVDPQQQLEAVGAPERPVVPSQGETPAIAPEAGQTPAVQQVEPVSQENAEKIVDAATGKTGEAEPTFRTEERNINMRYLDNLESDDDVARLMDEVARQNDGFKAARGKGQTHEQTMDAAEELLPWNQNPVTVQQAPNGRFLVMEADGTKAHQSEFLDPERAQQWADSIQAERGKVFEDLFEPNKTRRWEAHEVTAARIIVANSADHLQRRAREMVGNASAMTPADWVEFRRQTAQHQLFQKSLQSGVTKIAQALNAMRIPVRSAAKKAPVMRGQADNADEIVMEEILSGMGGVETIQKLAKKIADGKDLKQVNNLAKGGVWDKTVDGVIQFWINGILSGPTTHAKNMIGNTLTAAWSVPERAAAGVVGSVRRGLTGKNDGVRINESLAMLTSTASGFIDGVRLAGRSMAYREETMGMGTKLSDVGMDRQRAISAANYGIDEGSAAGKSIDFMGDWVIGWPGRALMAEDEFFKGMNYRMQLGATAHRKASMEVSDGVLTQGEFKNRVSELMNSPTEDMYAESMKLTQVNTFTNPISSDMVKSIQQMSNKHRALKFVIPFIRTPFNLTKYAFERSPLGVFGGEFQRAMKAGGAEADMAIGKVVTGSMTLYALSGFVSEGQITGAGPKNPALRAQWLAEGHQPYSIRVGDTMYSYKGTDPIGMQMALVADAIGSIALIPNSEDQDAAAFSAALGIGEAMTSKSYMQGLAQLFDILGNDHSSQFVAERMSQNFIASVIPRWVTSISKGGDYIYTAEDRQALSDETGAPIEDIGEGRVRRSYEAGGYLDDLGQMMKDRLWFNDELPPQVDVFGRPELSAPAAGPDFISPIYMSKKKGNTVLRELNNHEVALPRQGSTFTFDGAEFDVHEDVQDPRGKGWSLYELQTMVGKERYFQLRDLLNSEQYRKLPNKGDPGSEPGYNKADELELTASSAKQDAVEAFVRKHGLETEAAIRRSSQEGVRVNKPWSPLNFD